MYKTKCLNVEWWLRIGLTMLCGWRKLLWRLSLLGLADPLWWSDKSRITMELTRWWGADPENELKWGQVGAYEDLTVREMSEMGSCSWTSKGLKRSCREYEFKSQKCETSGNLCFKALTLFTLCLKRELGFFFVQEPKIEGKHFIRKIVLLFMAIKIL